MAATKFTAVFEVVTGTDTSSGVRRVGGWTESQYWTSAFTMERRNDFERYCQTRAAVLPKSARIVGQRYQQIDPIGATQSGGVVFLGNAAFSTDIPQMALLLKVPSQDFPNIAKKKIACIPDIMVEDGEYNPTPTFVTLMNNLLASLSLWKFLATNLSPTTFPIFSVGADGLVTTTVPHSFVVGNIVHVSKALGPYGVFFNGDFMIETPVTANTFKLVAWPAVAATGGSARLPTVLYPRMGVGVVNRVTTRKIGRPSTGFVGRVSKKR